MRCRSLPLSSLSVRSRHRRGLFLRSPSLGRWSLGSLPLFGVLLLVGCQNNEAAQQRQRLDRLELKLQQVEQRLAHPDAADTADKAGRPPAGPVKSLTFRMGSADDRLRIYWADGTSSDLPCTKEQATWACG